jgi:Protein of unknown function (DUF2721)
VQYQMSNNPFAVLTAIVAPAILTNASSVLALGTSNRLGRVVDRTRIVAAYLASHDPASKDFGEWSSQLSALETRAQMLIKALRLFYAALGLFAASALVSVAGSTAAYYGFHQIFAIVAVIATLTGVSAVIGLSVGCTLMIHETQLAVKSLSHEANSRIAHRSSPSPG